MTWDEYNDKVWDWSISTAVNRLSSLENLGDSTEVAELISHFGLNDKKAADRLLKRALADGLQFNVDGISELIDACNPELFKKALDVSAKKFKKADLEELYGLIDDEMLLEIANKYNIPLPSDFEDVHEITSEKVNTPIAWKEFYDEYCFWDDEYCKKRALMLTDFGKCEEEWLEVLNAVFGDDERGASTFVKICLKRELYFQQMH